jgi:hypothetical protein
MTLYAVVFAIYAFSMFWVFKVKNAMPGTGKRIAISLIYLVIFFGPIWDIPIQKKRFDRMCELESGMTVYRRVGLSEDYYFQPGEMLWKEIKREGGGSSGRDVAAGGDELKVKKLESDYRVVRTTDRDAAEWGRVRKFEYRIYDDIGILGSSVRLIGGAGWFANRFSLGPKIPGFHCPQYEYSSDRPSHGAILLYEVFYKLDD